MKTLKIKFPLTKKLEQRIIENIERLGENIAVGGIIKLANSYILVKNKKPPFNKGWIFPSGGIEDNETAKQALKREIKEETNLLVDVKKIHCVLVPINIKKSKIIIYQCQAKSSKIWPGDNIDAVGLFKKLPKDLNPICKKII